MATSKNLRRKGATSWKETKLGILPRHQVVRLEAEGVARGLAFVLKVATRPRLSITERLVLNLHKRSFGHLFAWAGSYRKIDIEVSRHKPPKPFEVSMHMKNFIGDLDVRLRHITPARVNWEQHIRDIIEIVVWSQHRFLWIHPFQDYNGRVARLLSNLILAYFRLPLIEIDFRDATIRSRYIQALQKADQYDYGDLTKVITKMLGAPYPSS